jgi:hypothetical protein
MRNPFRRRTPPVDGQPVEIHAVATFDADGNLIHHVPLSSAVRVYPGDICHIDWTINYDDPETPVV